jgi:hypothetical protein
MWVSKKAFWNAKQERIREILGSQGGEYEHDNL